MISWRQIKTKLLLFIYNTLAGDNDECEIVRKNTLTQMSQTILNCGDQIAAHNQIKRQLLKMAGNREWHIGELEESIPCQPKEAVAIAVNHVLGEMQDILNGKGYNKSQRWVVFNPAMSMRNERTLHDKQ